MLGGGDKNEYERIFCINSKKNPNLIWVTKTEKKKKRVEFRKNHMIKPTKRIAAKIECLL